ncbi:MAG: GAF domain-containing sensor histidine kinase [Acidimicrobiales bacterium]
MTAVLPGFTAGPGRSTASPARYSPPAPPAAGGGTLGPGSPLVSGVRWGTLTLGIVLAVARKPVRGSVLAWGAVLVAHTLWRTLGAGDWARHGAGPVEATGLQAAPAAARSWLARDRSLVLLELGVVLAAVVATGSWSSPYAFCLMTALIAAGFEDGFAGSARAAAATVAVVGVASMVGNDPWAAAQLTGQWAVELVLLAVLAGQARRTFGEAQERHSQALDRMDRLAEANDLLVSLHHVAQSLPATLNLSEVLASTATRLHSLVDCDVLAVLLRDDPSSRWTVAVGEGTRIAGSVEHDDLPAPLSAATSSSVASLVVVLAEGEGIGVDLLSWSGLYAPLRARGRLIGLVALEHHEPGQYGRRELQLLDGFLETAALAIDNARWFARLRSMGADEERVRIARDMHDRVGQSLATLAFRLDRLTRQAAGSSLAGELDLLRGEVREVLGDVRATLSDLRTDVSDQRGLVETLEAFLERVEERSGIEASLTREVSGRLPLLQERELWRIAHEAVTNVERHARAASVAVRWTCDGSGASLEVADDGTGFSVEDARADSFGLTGMRERADAIGATLDITSGARGTVVRCRLAAA